MTTASTASTLTSTLANNTAAAVSPNVNIDSAAAGAVAGAVSADGANGSKLASPADTPLDESSTNGFNTAPNTSEEDNLDYESEDDDDSRSNYSTHNNSTNNTSNISTLSNGSSRSGRHYGRHSSGLKGEETKRSHHNVLERKRRDLLKDSFTKLRDSVISSQPKERVSRAEILKQAADFIQSRVQRNAAIRAELDELIRKNQELEQKHLKTTTPSAAAAAATTAPTTTSTTTPTTTTSSAAAPDGDSSLFDSIAPNQPNEPTMKREL